MARPLSVQNALRLTLTLSEHPDRDLYRRSSEQWIATLGGQVENVPATHQELLRVAFLVLPWDRWLGCTVIGSTLTAGGQTRLAATVTHWWTERKLPDPLLPY